MKTKKLLLFLITSLTTFTNSSINNDIKINNTHYKSNITSFNITNIGELLLNDIRNITGLKYELKDVQPIEDTKGNLYFCANFLPYGYSIYEYKSGNIIETNPKVNKEITSDKFYVPFLGFYENKDTRLINDVTNYELDVSYATNLIDKYDKGLSFTKNINNINYVNNKIDLNSSITPISNFEIHPWDDNRVRVKTEKEVEFADYFRMNKENFSYNTKNSCGYTAASLILAYTEFFKSHGFFSTEEHAKFIEIAENANWIYDGVPGVVEDFAEKVWGNDIGSSWSQTINDALHKFLKGKSVQYNIYNQYAIFGNPKHPIDDGFPSILFGSIPNIETKNEKFNHAVVVYGYLEDGRLLCHYGWQKTDYTQVVINFPSMSELGSTLALYSTGPHRCCMPYNDGTDYWCPVDPE